MTNIDFSINEEEFVSLKIYDITGKEVKILVSQNLKRGNYTYNFFSEGMPSGIYIYSLSSGKMRINKKMIMIK